MSKYSKTYMECLEIAAARLGTPELAIDIQFAHEDKHYELMQTAADLYLYLSDLHKHSVGGPASASALDGEQLGNEAGGKSVWEGCECDEDWGHDAELKCFKCGKLYRD